jgi:putative ABC transport system permease protein
VNIVQASRLLIFPSWRLNFKLILLAIFSISIGVALVVSIINSNKSILEQFNYSNKLILGKQTARLQSISNNYFSDTDLTDSLIDRLNYLDFVPVLEIKAFNTRSGSPITILGLDLLNDHRFRDYDFEYKTRDFPLKEIIDENTAGLIVPESLKPIYALDEEEIVFNSQNFKLKINQNIHLKNIGIIQSNPNLVIADIKYLQKALNLPNKYTSLDFKNILASDLKVKLNNYYNFQISEPSDYKKQVESLTEAFRFNLQALSYIALLVSFYLIFQTIFISFQRKSKEIGILKTLGFSQKQIFTVLMVEAGLLGLIGSLIGCLLGIWLSGLILATLQKTVNELYFSVESIKLILSWQGILSGFILGLATCILGGFPAAVGAVFGISPQINLQSSQFKNFKQIPVSYLKTIYLSGSLILLLLLLVQNLLFKIPNKYLGFIMAFIVLIGFSLVAGLFLEIIKSTISKIQNWFGQLFSIRLSVNFIRLWIAIGALICGLSMTLSINFMIDSFRGTVNSWIQKTLKADIYISPQNSEQNINANLLKQIQTWPQIQGLDYLGKHRTQLNNKPIIIAGSNLKYTLQNSNFIEQIPNLKNTLLQNPNYILISNTLALKHALKAGNNIDLKTALGMQKFYIAGIYQDYSSEHGYLLMHYSTYTKFFNNYNISNVALYLSPEESAEKVKAKLFQLPEIQNLKVQGNNQLKTAILKIFDQTFKISYLFFWIALIISIFTVSLTLVSCIEENYYLNLISFYLGNSYKQIIFLEIIQGLLITVIAIIFSIPSGYWLATILQNTVNNNSFGWIINLHINWFQTSIICGLAVLGALIGTIAPLLFKKKLFKQNSLN